MIISPCAMLMTPITPKVIASPIAASSSTEPRLMPNSRFSAMPNSHSFRSMVSIAPCRALRTSGSGSASDCRRRSSRERMSGSEVPARARAAARRRAGSSASSSSTAMPTSSLARTALSVSRSRAWRNRGRIRGSGFLIRLSAASSRRSGSSLNSANRPVTPRISRRNRLLTLIFFNSFLPASGSARPLAASWTRYFFPERSVMTMRPSPLRTYSRPLASASSA